MTPQAAVTAEAVWLALESVMDPEIPVVSVVDLGIIRGVAVDAGRVTVDMLPTFAGCPALDVMRRDIGDAVRQLGADDVTVNVKLSPPWSTDMLSDAAREKLRAFGLTPPVRHGGQVELILLEEAACPNCQSYDTTLKNSFGPTLCRAIYYCNNCQQPFEQFKGL